MPVTPDTIFQSGSLGKQFTAAAVMLQVEDGKLALTDSVTKFFPDAPQTWRAITVEHLLTHTSGIPDYTDGTIDYRKDYTEDELAKFAFGLKLEFPAGSRWNYSNTGYVLLGAIVRKVSGSFYGDVLRDARLQAARHDDGARHQRSGHRPEPRRRLSPREGRAEKPGMGGAADEHDGGRLALLLVQRSHRLGSRPSRERLVLSRAELERRCSRRSR